MVLDQHDERFSVFFRFVLSLYKVQQELLQQMEVLPSAFNPLSLSDRSKFSLYGLTNYNFADDSRTSFPHQILLLFPKSLLKTNKSHQIQKQDLKLIQSRLYYQSQNVFVTEPIHIFRFLVKLVQFVVM